MVTQLLARARAGDGDAFSQLVEPHRHELLVHCYRLLGSLQDAEDALQESMLSAWQGLGGFEERASLRSWLYRIATNRCLNSLRSASRRHVADTPGLSVEPPEPNRLGEILWLEPYPDILLGAMPDREPGPEARYESREAISLAFVTALQLLPSRQRAVLILRDVLGFRAAEVAEMLESTEESVTSALKRARSAIERRLPGRSQEPPAVPSSAAEADVVERLTRAYELGDIDELVALLTDDVVLAMPPLPLEYHGRELAERFLRVVAFRDRRTFRLVWTRANGQPAFGSYLVDPRLGAAHAVGLFVLTLAGGRISALTRFDNSVLSRFGLPRTLPADAEA